MASEFQEISTDLADFVSKMTHSITQAQNELDKNAVAMLQELAASKIKIPFITHEVTEVKNAEGITIDNKVNTTRKDLTTSLLDLGVRPTFYQFAETLIDVALDMHIEEEIKTNSNTKTKRFMVSTKNVRRERRYARDLKAHSKLSVKMVPVPMPVGISDLVTHTVGDS